MPGERGLLTPGAFSGMLLYQGVAQERHMTKSMATFRERLMVALWLPLVWLCLLAIDIVAFAGARPHSLLPRLFEDVVFLLSFFFFRRGFDVGATWTALFVPFVLQFFFWWILSFLAAWAVARWRHK